MFRAINGKQLPFFMNPLDQILIAKYKTGSGDNHPSCYCPQRDEKIRHLPHLPKEPDPSDLKLQETFSL